MRKTLTPWLFLLPYILITGVFFLWPLISATVLAFQQTNGPKSRTWVGFDNFTYILNDRVFYTALFNTALYAVVSVIIQLPLSLSLAMLLNSGKDRMRGFFRLAIFSPHLVGQVFVGILFSVLFVPRYGLVNQGMQLLFGAGLETRWLEEAWLVRAALILASMWMYVGFNMIYFLAALQNVPKDLEDAARVDGAGPWSRFRHVTLPAIKPVMIFVIVMSTIGSFQLFELPYTLVEGWGPEKSALSIVGYLYDAAFSEGDLGLGSAVGWVLTFIIFVISLAQIRLSGSMKKGGDT